MATKENPAKSKTELQPQNQTPPPVDQQGLVTAMTAALTEAIRAARRDVPPPDQAATDAAAQYAQIKAALRTVFEK